MFTDIVGYTALTGSNESLAMDLLREHRNIVRPILQEHSGREIKTIGDAFLVEFSSALEAVKCAFQVQQAMHNSNASKPKERQVMLRIGIHLGDVIEDRGDLLGDAVNIASRIEPLAPPGGISVTEQVYSQVKNKLPYGFTPLGQRQVKNVKDPIIPYSVDLPWESEEGSEARLDTTRVAVLPFANYSSDPNDAYFADGITEEIISTVSGVSGLSVISRTSIMGYKGTSKKVKEIGKELEVGSVLEGSFRKAGNRIRITTQLIDVAGDKHLWAQNYDRELNDVFEVQSDIARQVAEALKVKILPNDQKKIEKTPTRNADAHAMYLKGRYFWNQRTRESLQKAVAEYKGAIALDQGFALAYSGMADCYLVMGNFNHMPFSEAFPRARENALKAVGLDPTSGEAHTSLASALGSLRDLGAEDEFKRAIELNPSYATAHHWYGILLMHSSRLDQALQEAKRAQQLDPLSPQIATFLGIVLLSIGDLDECEKQLQRALELSPNHVATIANLVGLRWRQRRFAEADELILRFGELTGDELGRDLALAASYAQAGRKDAREALTKAESLPNPDHAYENTRVIAYLALGDTEKAIGLIQDEYLRGADWLGEVRYDPVYSSVRDDPRVQDVLRKAGAIR